MDGARLCRFPHHAWLSFSYEARAGEGLHVFPVRGVACVAHLTVRGRYTTRWGVAGNETTWATPDGQVHFMPADDREHVYIADAPRGYVGCTIIIPRRHLAEGCQEPGMRSDREPRRLLVDDDPTLRSCMLRIAAPAEPDDAVTDVAKDEAARRLVIRLQELAGAGVPDWHDDVSVFDRRTLDHLVTHIDEHLRIAPALSDMALLVGMSPSHFARKFRQSTGLSLGRFINRRRIRKSLTLLKTASCITSIAIDLGFSSQSHFTRVFSSLTGRTPARHQKQPESCLLPAGAS